MASPSAADSTGSGFLLVGTATSVPGASVTQMHASLMEALHSAAEGRQVLNTSGQEGPWLNKRFIASQLQIGHRTWKRFKKEFADRIDLDYEQQWVRLRPQYG